MLVFSVVYLASVVAAWPAFFSSSSSPGHFSDYHDTFDATNDAWEPFKAEDLKTEKHKYIPPGKDDIRSPCPWLSTCANHGIIPRSGKNIHFESLFRCANFGGHSKTLFKTTRTTPIKMAKFYNKQDVKAKKPNPHPLDRIDLGSTGYPPFPLGFLTEHDLSLLRFDLDYNNVNLQRDARPNRTLTKGLLALATKRPGCKQQITDQWLDSLECQPVDEACYLDYDDLTAWMLVREQEEELRHKTLKRPIIYNLNEEFAATGEAVFLMELMGRPNKDGHARISLEHARSFLWHEKIPCDWTPPPELAFPVFLAKMVKIMHKYRSAGVNKKAKKAEFKDLPEEDYKKILSGDVYKHE